MPLLFVALGIKLNTNVYLQFTCQNYFTIYYKKKQAIMIIYACFRKIYFIISSIVFVISVAVLIVTSVIQSFMNRKSKKNKDVKPDFMNQKMY